MYYGRGRDEDNAKLIAFIDEVFFTDDPSNREFLAILPKIYKDKYRPAYSNFVAQDESGTFRSAIGNFYCPMKVGGEALSACCIGNVAVGKQYRGMGYMKKLLAMSCEDMKNNGVDLAYLGGQRQRYGYFGFEHAGVSFTFGISRNAYRHALGNIKGGYEIEELSPDNKEDIQAILDIYNSGCICAARPVEDCDDILRSWRQVPYVLRENGEFAGYMVLGYEHDCVCEFGMKNPADYPRMVGAAFEIRDRYDAERGLRFECGGQEKDKVDFFTKYCDGIDMGGCEMILVYDFAKVIRAYMKAKATYCRLADGEMTVLIHGLYGDENLTIGVKDNSVSVEKTDKKPDAEFDHYAATRAFFSLYPNERYTLPTYAQQWLPLPMYQSPCDTM